ncbi:MAG: LuxR C-terminal-related transcriptional regulator [Bacteroidota bacterium]
MPCRVVLADNQQLTAAGLLYFLSGRQDVEVVDQVHHRGDLLNSLQQHEPHLLIADYNLPGFVTLEDLRMVNQSVPRTNMLIISADNNKASILEVLQVGVKGYLTKECSKDEVMMAIQSATRGEKYYCHKILDIIMEDRFPVTSGKPDPAILTIRETEILKLIAVGKSTQQIADELYLSPHTVQTHRKSIIRKLHIKSPTEFVIRAMDIGIIAARSL